MVKISLNLISKFSVFSSILIISILVFISYTREYIAHKYYIEYEKVSKENKSSPETQIRLLKKTIKNSPSNADALFNLGSSYIRTMSYTKSERARDNSYYMATDAFLKALILKPASGRHWARYAWNIGLNGETNEAIEYFEKAISLYKTDAIVHSLYAKWCINLVKKEIDFDNYFLPAMMDSNIHQKDKNLQHYDNHLINGASIATFLETAQIEWDKAISLKATKNDAAFNKGVYNSLADLYLIKYDLDKAISYYIATNNTMMTVICKLIKGDYGRAVGTLGQIIENGGTLLRSNLFKIRKLLEFAVKKDTKNYMASYWLGEIYSRVGVTQKARYYFMAVTKLNPGHIDTHLKLAKIYKSSGQTDLAVKEFEIIISLDPGHKEALYLLGKTIIENY